MARRPAIHWPSVWQFGLSLLAVVTLWEMAALLTLLGLFQRFNQPSGQVAGLSFVLVASGVAFTGLLLLPSAGYALARLTNNPIPGLPSAFNGLRLAATILALPLVLLAGHYATKVEVLSWMLLPRLHVLAIGLPVLWIAYLGQRDVPLGPPQQGWGMLACGLVLAPGLILVAEMLVVAILVLGVAIFISVRPDIMAELQRLFLLLASNSASPEEQIRLLAPYLIRPGGIFAILALGAVLIPLIEELVKPVGVWLLAGASLSPAQGFAAGVLSGAGYALIESMLLASQVDQWAALVIARIGTAAIHTFATGLTAWALVQAWSEGRYLRLGVSYLAAAALHGLWNCLTLLIVFSNLASTLENGRSLEILQQAGRISPYALAGIAAAAFLALLWANRRLRQTSVEITPSGASVV